MKDVLDIYPLSHLQEGILFHSLAEPETGAYLAHAHFVVDGGIDRDALRRAWAELFKRHEILRTVFVWEGLDRPMQVVRSRVTVPWTEEDWRRLSDWERTARREALLAATDGPLDLSKGPLTLFCLARCGPETYELLWVFHQILLDGWSLSLLMRDFFDLYERMAAGEEARPLDARLFGEYVAWLHRQDLTAAEAFWRQALAGFTRPTPLGLRRSPDRSNGDGRAHRQVYAALPRTTTAALQAMARDRRLTLSTVVQGAWALQLAPYAPADEVVFGVTVSGRPPELRGIEEIVGVFTNTLPLRVVIDRRRSVADWLAAIQEHHLEMRQYEFSPLVRIREWCGLPHGQIFDSMLVFENYPYRVGEEQAAKLAIRSTRFMESSHYPLSLGVLPGDDLVLRLSYDRRVCDRGEARRRLDLLVRLLTAMAEAPDARVAELPSWTAAQRHQVLAEWNDTGTAASGQPFYRAFEAWAARSPDLPAVRWGDSVLSYGELEARSASLARALRRHGAGPEERVAVLLDRSPELLVALLGITRSGAAWVPLDPSQPALRLASTLADCGARLVVTRRGLRNEVAEDGVQAILVEEHLGGRTEAAGADALSGWGDRGEHAAYLLYTSGSTGRPKAVVVEHRSLSVYLDGVIETLLADVEVLPALSQPVFDASLKQLLAPLMAGQTVWVPTEEETADPRLLVKRLRSTGGALNCVPSLWEALLDALPGGPGSPAFDPVLLGGEPVHADLVARSLERFPELRLWNLYGPTEATANAAWARLGPERPVPIGRPVPGGRIYLADAHLAPVPPGATGEVFIGGTPVARGYLGRRRLTAERFVPDPFGAAPGGRLYRSGDAAFQEAGGRIHYLHRLDRQVKVRGFRVEPGEVEGVLSACPEVAEAVVVPWAEGELGGCLVAYVVPSAAGAATADLPRTLRAHAGKRLPAFMVPTAFTVLDDLPRTATGKVDRSALPPPVEVQISTAPRTSIEERLATIWKEILNISRVDVGASFFELGGNSLSALQMIGRVRSELGVDLPLRALLDDPSLAGLAAEVARAEGKAQAVELPVIVVDREARHEPFPLTSIQQAYWAGRSGAFELGDVATHAYLEIEGNGLELARLEEALRRLVARHDMLRMVVLPRGEQHILSEVEPYRIPVRDLREASQAERDGHLEAVRSEMSHQVLDPARWPLFDLRATLLRGSDVRLHVSLDLLIGDALSWDILIGELSALYARPDLVLPELDLSFRDYVVGLAELEAHPVYRRSQEYWVERLEDLPPAPELPLVREPASILRPRFDRRRQRLEPEVWSRLRERLRQRGLTASGLLLTAYAEVLATWSRHPRFTLNLTLFNRLPLHPEVHRIVGDFTSVTLLEVDTPPGAPFEERARRVQERLWDDLDHRYFDGIAVMRELARVSGGLAAARMPVVFTSTLDMEPVRTVEAAGDGPRLQVAYSIGQTSQVWLDNQVVEQDGALVYTWDAVEELFPEGLLDDMFAAYGELLRRLAVSREAWRGRNERHLPARQLEERAAVNRTAVAVEDGWLHSGFEAWAEAAPARPALVTPSRIVSFGELERLANRLANRLRSLGVAPDRLVAVVMEKGWQQVAAVLAILKAGGAYLPIAADWPRRRQWNLMARGEVALAVTQPWLRDRLEWSDGLSVLTVEDEANEAFPEERPHRAQVPSDLAYVIFTSGSTGEPKGVAVEHRAAWNTVVDVGRRFGVGADDRVLAVSSLSFDLSVYDVFGLLGAGGAVVLPEPSAQRDAERWLDLLVDARVTVWNSVPTLMEMLVEMAALRTDLAKAADPRLVLLSGDWFPVSLPDRIREVWPRAQVVSLGGATEAAIWSIAYPCDRVDPAWRSIPYGRPLANQRFHVLDEAWRPRPTWVPGQLYIAGRGLARGYWRDDERTAESFFDHPATGERLYRTGDLGRYLPGGDIEFLGREDSQVKVRGHRIELGEIEAALERHAAVRSAVVDVRGRRREDRRLVAYVVPERSMAPAPQAADLAVLEHKLSEPGLRRDGEDRLRVALVGAEADPERLAAHRQRRTHRSFLDRPIPAESFGRFLGVLQGIDVPEAPLPKYLYPSAGSLYPVQVYVAVEAGGVESLEVGVYYYHPRSHELVLIAPGRRIPPDLHGPRNRPIAAVACLTLLLVGRLGVLEPIYGDWSRSFAMYEAGAMSQLLMTSAAGHGIGLCPIGTLEFETLAAELDLAPGDELLHTLVGGAAADTVAEEMGSAGLGALEEHLRSVLPAYMVPEVFVPLDALPLTANGKVDRSRLPEPGVGASDGEGEAAPDGELEAALSRLLAEVLGIEAVPRDVHFFELGGNSLHLIRFHRRIVETLGRELQLVDIFDHPTVRSLAALLSGRGPEAAAAAPLEGPEGDDRQARRREGRDRLRRRHPQMRQGGDGWS